MPVLSALPGRTPRSGVTAVPRLTAVSRVAAFASVVVGALALGPGAADAQSVTEAVSEGLLSRLETVSGNVLAAAQQVPEDQYSYRPTEEVRTFGEIVNHVADAQFGYCAAGGGGDRPEAASTQATTKAEIVDRYRAAHEFCLEAYRNVEGDALGETVSIFGGEDTRAGILIQNVAHSNLHYGNLITYMRAIGMVPPSSQG